MVKKGDLYFSRKSVDRVLNPDKLRRVRALRVQKLIRQVEDILYETHHCDCLDCEPRFQKLREALKLCKKRD